MPLAQKSGPAQSTPITSRDNQGLKRFRAALRDGLIEDDIVGLEGPHLIAEAIAAGLAIPALLCSPAGDAHLQQLQRSLSNQTQILHTTDKLFASLSGTKTPQGIAALAPIRRATLDDLLTSGGRSPLLVGLIGVQDPGNVGSVIRACEGFGASGSVVTTGSANPWGQKSLRASAGSALRLPILAGIQPAVAMAQLRVAGVKLMAATASEGQVPTELDLTQPTALLIGNEGAGLPGEVVRSADLRVRIPQARGVDSLNAAVAAAVLLYEAARQRGFR